MNSERDIFPGTLCFIMRNSRLFDTEQSERVTDHTICMVLSIHMKHVTMFVNVIYENRIWQIHRNMFPGDLCNTRSSVIMYGVRGDDIGNTTNFSNYQLVPKGTLLIVVCLAFVDPYKIDIPDDWVCVLYNDSLWNVLMDKIIKS